jgi:prepilin-type processing-associated H-X9-DG protein
MQSSAADDIHDSPPPADPARPSLAPVLFVAAIVALAAIGPFIGWGNLFGSLYMLAIVVLIFAAAWALCKKRILLMFLFVLAMVTMLIPIIDWGATSAARENANRASCLNNLKNLGTAIENHVASKDALPAVFTQDSDGKPLTSWRTRLLPYLERADIYQAYQPKEPWDSTNNKPLAKAHIDLFCCPSDASPATPQTNYVAILAPGSAWIPGRGIKFSEIKDNPADSILLVEMKNSGIAWAEPRDLDLNNLPPGITPQNLLTSLSAHPGVFNALFADGHVESIPATIPWADFLAMLTIAGGETIGRSKW